MTTKKPNMLNLTEQIRSAVTSQAGLSVKDLASRLKVIFSSWLGFYRHLRSKGKSIIVGSSPARIYFEVPAGPSRSKATLTASAV